MAEGRDGINVDSFSSIYRAAAARRPHGREGRWGAEPAAERKERPLPRPFLSIVAVGALATALQYAVLIALVEGFGADPRRTFRRGPGRFGG
jgi:hypothetical protein